MSSELNQLHQLVNFIAQIIYDKKGHNIIAIDVRETSSLTDCFIVAQGSIDRHVQAIGRELQEKLTREGVAPLRHEGLSDDEWVVLDFGDVIVHLLTAELREKYRLEQVWQKGKILPTEIKTALPYAMKEALT